MNAKSLTDLTSWIAVIVALIAACWGIVAKPPSLKTPRPILPENEERSKPGDEQSQSSKPAVRNAQLWEDPFAVFEQQQNFDAPITDRMADALIIVITTPMVKYPEYAEWRLKNRYALQNAMRDCDYVPLFPGRLASLKVSSVDVPYESFRLRAGKTSNPSELALILVQQPDPPKTDSTKRFPCVHVVWLPEETFVNRGVSLSSIEDKIQEGLGIYSEPSFCWIGPTDSDSLARLISAGSSKPLTEPGAIKTVVIDKGGMNHAAPNFPPKLNHPYKRFISFAASAFPEMLQLFSAQQQTQRAADTTSPQDLLADVVRQRFVLERNDLLQGPDEHIIERIGADDFDLCRALLEEIERRTKTTGFSKRRIAIVAEWDTLYSRAAAFTLQSLAKGAKTRLEILDNYIKSSNNPLAVRTVRAPDAQVGLKTESNPQVDIFTYLRGLDGLATLHASNYAQAEKSNTPDSEEPPEGKSQIDYVRRLAEFLVEDDTIGPDLKAPDAIVVLGNDIYDKLTILKLLRSRFRQTLFLTTGLSALYWHPEYAEYTRNLVVASSFPLKICNYHELTPEERRAHPERLPICEDRLPRVVFRDSYQTSLYFAALHALENEPIAPWCKRPRLFEIGNTQAIRLNDPMVQPKTRFFEDFAQGVNTIPSLLIEALAILLGTLFLVRIRDLSLHLKSFPPELYEGLYTYVPSKTINFLRQFVDIVHELERLSEADGQQYEGFQACRQNLADLREELRKIANNSQPEQAIKTRLERAIDQLHSRLADNLAFIPNATGGPRTTRIFRLLFCEIEHFVLRRRLRAVACEVSNLVAPVLEAAAEACDTKAVEIEAFKRYFKDPPWYKFSVFSMLLIGTFLSLIFYVYYNPDFQGFLGPETRDLALRWTRVGVSIVSLFILVLVVAAVCRLQLKSRRLIYDLSKMIGKRSAMSDRQTIVVIADKSDPVTQLCWVPCIMLFILSVAHMRAINGVPATLPHFLVGATLLGGTFLTAILLSAAVVSAKRRVTREYEREIVAATRLESKILTVTTVHQTSPAEDGLLVDELAAFAKRNSAGFQINEARLKGAGVRELADKLKKVLEYLRAIRERNQHILNFVPELRSSSFLPIAIAPALGAFLIPIGGVSGLTVLELAVKLLR
jgi:hypothetical protein